MAPRDGKDYLQKFQDLSSAKRTHVSFPQLKYPSLRDEGLRDNDQWLLGKQMDDGAEGFWRVHDKLYDLTDFVKKHPGGEDWLVLSKGTDVTEAFECHHIYSNTTVSILAKYYARDATTIRNSPFTFREDGFYRTLKEKVREKLKDVPKDPYIRKSANITDLLLLSVLVTSPLACLVENSYLYALLVTVAGVSLTWVAVCAHNYLHKKDNWRMYIINLTLMNYREWRIIHVLSHHLYPNTLMDLEMSTIEPLLQWLPRSEKSMFIKIRSFLLHPIITLNYYTAGFFKQVALTFMRKNYISTWRWHSLIPLALPLFMWLVTGADYSIILRTWLIIVFWSSFVFGTIALNAAHHHPDIFHDGDQLLSESRDWGIHQLHAVADRPEINGSLFRVMTFFGDHALHHLFPTLDHALLPRLYPLLLEHCEKYGVKFQTNSQIALFLGQYQQILKTVPKIVNEK